MQHDIILSTINAKWIHPSLALRLLKANLGQLEDRCGIIEFALRQPLHEKLGALPAERPRVMGFSVSIWNHTATLELLEALETKWKRPVIVLGGPELSRLPPDAAIFRYADFVVRGDGEHAFREICEHVLCGRDLLFDSSIIHHVDINTIKTAYYLYTDEDLRTKLTYVESGRGCPFNCEFCLSSVKTGTSDNKVAYFPLTQFLHEMDNLIQRGAKTFKFLDRTFNLDIPRAVQILEFFLNKIDERRAISPVPFVVHFEMVPSRFPNDLLEILGRFPPGSLRLEIGIQTLDAEVSARIGRPSRPDNELETLRLLREKTNAIVHADLIAGLPGEGFASFAAGFDRLWAALSSPENFTQTPRAAGQSAGQPCTEIQLGILKLLPGAPIARHSAAFGMRYNSLPPYEVIETAALSAHELDRIKNFARFWELIVNRGLMKFDNAPVFAEFMAVSDSLLAHFGRNWGIDKNELLQKLLSKDM